MLLKVKIPFSHPFLYKISTFCFNYCRAFGIIIVDEKEKAWFPAEELKEFHGIVNHEVTVAESVLFCIRPDGSEGSCLPAQRETQYQGVVNDFEDDEL